MGFRNGAWAKIWDIKIAENGKSASVKISISKKDEETGTYKQTFGQFVRFAGDALKKVKSLNAGTRVKLVSVDVENKYDKETKVTTYYHTVWDIQPASGSTAAQSSQTDDDGDIPF